MATINPFIPKNHNHQPNMKIKKLVKSVAANVSLLILITIAASVSAGDFLGFTPSTDPRTIGHEIFWGPDTNTAAWHLDVGYAGNTTATATNFPFQYSSNPPPNGSWVSVRAVGYDATATGIAANGTTNKIYSVLAPPVYYDTNLLTSPVTGTNNAPPTTPLTAPSNTVIYRQP